MKHFFRIAALLLAFCAFSFSAEAAARFAICATTCTWDASSTAMWSATSGGATGASVPSSADDVTLDAATCVGGTTCTITVNTTVTVSSITIGACTASTSGCVLDFSANNNSVTLSSTTGFSLTGTGTRTLNMGSGTFTLNSASLSTPWNAGTATNLTLNAGTSTIVITGTSITGQRTFSTGGKTYATVTFASGSSQPNAVVISGASPTITTLNLNSNSIIIFPSALTVTNAINWAGSAFSASLVLQSSSGGSATVSSANNGSIAWAAIANITFAGGGTFTATNSFNVGGTSGITITGPSGGGKIIGG